MANLAIVVPTVRPDRYAEFVSAWCDLIQKHNIKLFTVWDGDDPVVELPSGDKLNATDVMGGYYDLIYNFNDGVRNLGFAAVAKMYPNIEVIITLDDDVKPCGDTIQAHLDALDMRVPVSWLKVGSQYTRGFPYGVREEAEVVLSHGVWYGVADYDAPTQLVLGNQPITFYRGAVLKGIYYSMCGMNLAFKKVMLPYMYFAPMGHKVHIDRFADIWCGITSKRAIDENGWAAVSGYAAVLHDRASNVYVNLEKEAKGIRLNEGFWKGEKDDPYFDLYEKNLVLWQEFLAK